MGTKSNTSGDRPSVNMDENIHQDSRNISEGQNTAGHKEQHNEDGNGTDKEDKDRRRHVKGQKNPVHI